MESPSPQESLLVIVSLVTRVCLQSCLANVFAAKLPLHQSALWVCYTLMIASRTLGPVPNALHSIPFPTFQRALICCGPVLITHLAYVPCLIFYLVLLDTNTPDDP
jgi:hypothetical protein